MNKTLACMFPETLPDADFLFPLLQVFDQVVHMQAVENEPIETRSSFVERCISQGRLQALSPSPLSDDQRLRFMALVDDMRRHGADYISQLGMLTLAGLHRGSDQRESSRALVADLLQRTNIREREEEQLLLWQSRLVLKLGEWHDQQQSDIDSALHHIAARQDALLQELREEEDNPFSLTTELAESSREAETLLRQRLKAWCRLFWHGQVEAPGLLVTRHRTVMDLLHEVYEKQYRKPGDTVAILDLPCVTPDKTTCDGPLVGQFPELQQAVAHLSGPVSEDMAKDIRDQFIARTQEWQSLIAQRFPGGASNRCRLELVYFPEISCRRLLLEGFAGGVRSGNQENAEPEKGCCLGLLEGL